jgi:predicted glycoside hydrolase/deacetylase ChbG (UPF0249 family)
MTRLLVVNADDFGLGTGVNAGVARGHRDGIVTSASLMVHGPAAGEAARLAGEHPRLGVGLHVDIGEWACRDGGWVPVYERVRADDPAAVAAEVAGQLARFRSLTGRDPTHLDSHQHAHRNPPLRDVLREAAARLGVPLRHFSDRVTYRGDFYGQTADGRPWPDGIRPEALAAVIRTLPAGVTELGCHPAAAAGLPTAYDRERVDELAALCHPAVRAAVAEAGVRLVTFADLPPG